MVRFYNLNLYSSYPPIIPSVLGDSAHHQIKFKPQSFKDIGVLTEAVWLMQNESDKQEIPKILQSFLELSQKQSSLTSYMSDFNSNSEVNKNELKHLIEEYKKAFAKTNIITHLSKRMDIFLEEIKQLLDTVETNDIDRVKSFISNTKYLFRGALGVRHVDFIAYKKP